MCRNLRSPLLNRTFELLLPPADLCPIGLRLARGRLRILLSPCPHPRRGAFSCVLKAQHLGETASYAVPGNEAKPRFRSGARLMRRSEVWDLRTRSPAQYRSCHLGSASSKRGQRKRPASARPRAHRGGSRRQRQSRRHALETDWLAGRRDSNLRILCGLTKTLRLGGGIQTSASQNPNSPRLSAGSRTRTCASLFGNLVGSAALILMHRFESCRPAFA